jgi:hypothetical protein
VMTFLSEVVGHSYRRVDPTLKRKDRAHCAQAPIYSTIDVCASEKLIQASNEEAIWKHFKN